MSVSTLERSSGITIPFRVLNASILVCSLVPFGIAYIHEMTGDCRRRCHGRTDQVSTPAFALATFKVAVGSAGAAFALGKLVAVHGKAHAAPRLAPLETGLLENDVQTFGFRLVLNKSAAGHDHCPDRRGEFAAFSDFCGSPQIFHPAVS